VVGALVNVSQGLSSMGKDRWRRRVRAGKYRVYDSAGVLGSVLVRETAPRFLTLAMKPVGRKQFESVRVAAAIWEKAAVMR